MKPERIQFRASLIPEWNLDPANRWLTRDFQFSCHLEAMAFVDRVSEIAWEMSHVPTIVIDDYKVSLKLTTASIGRLSDDDFDLAEKIDELVIGAY